MTGCWVWKVLTPSAMPLQLLLPLSSANPAPASTPPENHVRQPATHLNRFETTAPGSQMPVLLQVQIRPGYVQSGQAQSVMSQGEPELAGERRVLLWEKGPEERYSGRYAVVLPEVAETSQEKDEAAEGHAIAECEAAVVDAGESGSEVHFLQIPSAVT